MVKRIPLLILCIFLSILCIAQDFVTVKGSVVDDAGKPVSGATIIAVGTKLSFKSGSNGMFEARIPRTINYLQVKKAGYTTKTAKVASSITVVLPVDVAAKKAAEEKAALERAAAEKAAAQKAAAQKEAARKEAEAKQKAEAAAKREKLEAEAAARREAEAKQKAEVAAKEKAIRERLEAEVAAQKEAEAKQKAEEEARAKAERERLEAEAAARREAEAKQKAEEDARAKAERERLEAEAAAQREAEVKQKAEEEARAKAERERLEAEAAAQREAEAKQIAEMQALINAQREEELELQEKEEAYNSRFKNKGFEHTLSFLYASEFATCDIIYRYSGKRSYESLDPLEVDYTLSYKMNRVFSVGMGFGMMYNAKSVSIINDEFCGRWEGFEEKRADAQVFASVKVRPFRSSVRPLLGASYGYYLLNKCTSFEGRLGLEFRLGRSAAIGISGFFKKFPYPDLLSDTLYGVANSAGAKVEFCF